MNNCLNTSDIRKLDLVAQERFSISGLLLMEHASLGLAEVLLSLAPDGVGRVLFLCGKGNHGGDGFAAARHLHNAGLSSSIVLAGRLDQIRRGSDAEMNALIATRMKIPIIECEDASEILAHIDKTEPDFVVDALLGTGLSSDVRGMLEEVIDGVNERRLDVTAVDMPSGLDSDTGLPLGTAIIAQRTVTFAFQKVGLAKNEARPYCGKIFVKGIGLPREVIQDPHAYL